MLTGPKSNKVIRLINRLEDGLLVLMLTAMILLAVFQVVSRNLFAEGVVWIDPLLRTLVLWVGLSGAVVATRSNKHIRIYIFTRYIPPEAETYVSRAVYLFTICLCLLISWHAARFVYSEYEYATVAFAGVPAWLTALIIPVCFLLIAIRYSVLFVSPSRSGQEKAAGL